MSARIPFVSLGWKSILVKATGPLSSEVGTVLSHGCFLSSQKERLRIHGDFRAGLDLKPAKSLLTLTGEIGYCRPSDLFGSLGGSGGLNVVYSHQHTWKGLGSGMDMLEGRT